MTEAVNVAIINSATVIVTILLSRLWSRREHAKTARGLKETADDVKAIKRIVNGGDTDRIMKQNLEDKRLAAVALRALANVTKKPADILQATEAELAYEEARQKLGPK